MSDTKVYAPEIRALLGTSSQFCEVVVLNSRTVPNGTTLSLRMVGVVPPSMTRVGRRIQMSSPYRRQYRRDIRGSPTVGNTVGTYGGAVQLAIP